MKPTQGPWKLLPAEGGNNYLRIRGTVPGKRFKIANVLFAANTSEEIEEATANGHLLLAAPDLLEALEQLVNVGCEYYDMDCGETGSMALKDAWDAIAKAKGEVPK